jgi:hypothetical protein
VQVCGPAGGVKYHPFAECLDSTLDKEYFLKLICRMLDNFFTPYVSNFFSILIDSYNTWCMCYIYIYIHHYLVKYRHKNQELKRIVSS